MALAKTLVQLIRNLFLLYVPFTPAKNPRRSFLIIYLTFAVFFVLNFTIILTKKSKYYALYVLFPILLSSVLCIAMVAAKIKFKVLNKIAAVIFNCNYELLLFLIHYFSIADIFLPTLIFAVAVPQVIVANIYFMESMTIVTCTSAAITVADIVRIIIYEHEANMSTILFLTVVSNIIFYCISYVIILDRTLITQLQQQSNVDHQIFKQSLDLCPVGFALFKNGVLNFTNKECKHILNIQDTDDVATAIDNLYSHSSIMSDNIKSSIKHMTIEIFQKSIDWKIKQVEFDTHPIIMHTFMDMSYVKAKQIAEMHRRSVEMLVATSTHELRSPLNGMKSSFIFLKQQRLNSSCSEIIERGLCSCDYQEALINDIMDFAKIQGDKIKLTFSIFSIRSLIQKCRDIMELPIKDKKLELKIEFQHNIDADNEIYSDERRLKQVMLNFMSNAIKFTSKGFIKLRVKWNDKRCKLSVIDTGIGIKNENITNLFKEFGMLSDSTMSNASGTGLGLYLSKKLVTLLGGEVSLKSTYGCGSTFSISLPLKCIQRPQNTDEANLQSIKLISNLPNYSDIAKYIMFIDDSAINITIMERMMKNMGYSTVTAFSGAEALDKISELKGQIRVAFIDLHMPLMDGYELADKINELWNSKAVNKFAMVALTGDEKSDVVSACKMHGFIEVLTKPISQNDISGLLNKYK